MKIKATNCSAVSLSTC